MSCRRINETSYCSLATGLRQSNVLGLEWSHVNRDTGHAWIDAAQSKNRKAIAVPLNATALAVLRGQLGKYSQRVFTYRGRPLDWGNTLAWREALKRAGIEKLPLARLAAHLGIVASPSRDADARAAAPGRWALLRS